MANKLPSSSNKQKKTSVGNSSKQAEQARVRIRPAFDDMSRPIHQIVPVSLFALAFFLSICFFVDGSCAIVGDILRALAFGLFGRLTASVIMPLLLLYTCISWRRHVRNHRLVSHCISVVLLLLVFPSLVYTVANSHAVITHFDLKTSYFGGNEWNSGGFFGNTIAFFVVNLVGKLGSYILTALVIVVFSIISCGFTPSLMAERIRDAATARVQRKRQLNQAIRDEERAQKEKFRQAKEEAEIEERRAAIALRAEKRKQRYEEKAEQKRKRNEKREEDRRRKAAFAAETEKSRQFNRTQFKHNYDIAIEDDIIPPVTEQSQNEEKFMDNGQITTRRADTVLRGIDNSDDMHDPASPEPTDYEAITEHVLPPVKPTYDITVNNKLWDAEAELRAKAKEKELPPAQDLPSEPDPQTDAVPKKKQKAPEGQLVTPDMISTKTHIEASDRPTDDTVDIIDDEELEREKERKALEKMYASYAFPPLTLLAQNENVDAGNITEEINQNANKLVETLTSFNVRTTITSVSRGPRITRYELVPDAGIRIRSIANLIDDISMNLASAGIRIEAPIPGKAAVGVEVPNKTASTVRLRELLENETFKNAAAPTTVCVGADVTGDPVFCDIAKMPHALIAGATGMGKSVCINIILVSLLYKARPDEVKLILVDPKKVELGVYNGIPHLLVPVVIDPKKAAGALSWAVCEMERRFDLIEEAGVRDIKGYNKTLEEHPEREKLPNIVIVIDELNDLMMVASDSVEASICRIAQKARAAGIHLIIGTQRPSVDVITGTIKANIPSRIAFHVASQIDSRTILDAAGADKLLNNGDMLFFPVGYPKPLRVQGAFISDGEVEKVTSFLKQNTPAGIYNSEVMENIEREAERCMQNGKRSASDDAPVAEDGDETLANPKFREAVEIAIDEGKISTSLIQRRLKLGFGKAARFIDIMQRMGIVSEPDGQKPRTTLIDRDQFYQLLNRMDDEK